MRTAAVRCDPIVFCTVPHNRFQFLPVSSLRWKLNGLKPCGINNQKKWCVAGIGVAFPQGLSCSQDVSGPHIIFRPTHLLSALEKRYEFVPGMLT